MQNDPSSSARQVDTRKWRAFDRNVFQLERDGKPCPRFRFVADDPRTGRQVKRTLQARTRTEARVEAGELRAGLAQGRLTLGDRGLTVEALAASWEARERGPLGKLSGRTVEHYAQVLRSHVVPALGARTKVHEVSVADVRRMIDRAAVELSGSAVNGLRSACSACFKHAVRDLGAIEQSPLSGLLRGDMPSTRRQTEPRYLSVAEVERLLVALSDESRPIAAACFYGGLRISEALKLTWAALDFAGQSIAVPGTKTTASRAEVPLLPALARELQAHRERQAQQGFERIGPEALVFQTASGRSPSRRNLLRAVQAAARRAGLVAEGQEQVGLHDLRHSLAANAFGLGLSPAEVARLLRHANPRVTLSVYGGLTSDAVASLGSKLAAMGGVS